jgi:hypothetical protein
MTMTKIIIRTLLVLAALLVLSPKAEAQMAKRGTYAVHFGWHSAGKVFELEKEHVFWVGEFSGTTFNDEGKGFLHNASLVCPASYDIRPGGIAQGVCIMTDLQGDKAFSVWKCTVDQPGPGGKCEGDNRWTGGTGKYAGLKGGNRFYGVTILPTSSGYSVLNGEWELP